MSTYRQLLKEGEQILRQAGVEDWQLDAWYLFSDSFGISRAMYYIKETEEAQRPEEALYRQQLARRASREPLQYILENQEFMGLSFSVSPEVLIPRQDTEALVEEVFSDWKREERKGKRGLDVCTGSGCIAVSLSALGGFSMDACDISVGALSVAKKNAAANGCEIRFWEGDLFGAVPRVAFDLIVSNPPYIRSADILTLQPEVWKFEPVLALDGREDGLFFYRRIAEEAPGYLQEGGRLYLEIGWDQAEDVAELLKKQGFVQVKTVQDAAGKDRVVKALWRKNHV